MYSAQALSPIKTPSAYWVGLYHMARCCCTTRCCQSSSCLTAGQVLPIVSGRPFKASLVRVISPFFEGKTPRHFILSLSLKVHGNTPQATTNNTAMPPGTEKAEEYCDVYLTRERWYHCRNQEKKWWEHTRWPVGVDVRISRARAIKHNLPQSGCNHAARLYWEALQGRLGPHRLADR